MKKGDEKGEDCIKNNMKCLKLQLFGFLVRHIYVHLETIITHNIYPCHSCVMLQCSTRPCAASEKGWMELDWLNTAPNLI